MILVLWCLNESNAGQLTEVCERRVERTWARVRAFPGASERVRGFARSPSAWLRRACVCVDQEIAEHRAARPESRSRERPRAGDNNRGKGYDLKTTT
ncbi:MAG: hypothetical protein H6713_19700 [Myxococcales bacterium]|nr:hypothetical protein [Myxococcales bacterium]